MKNIGKLFFVFACFVSNPSLANSQEEEMHPKYRENVVFVLRAVKYFEISYFAIGTEFASIVVWNFNQTDDTESLCPAEFTRIEVFLNTEQSLYFDHCKFGISSFPSLSLKGKKEALGLNTPFYIIHELAVHHLRLELEDSYGVRDSI